MKKIIVCLTVALSISSAAFADVKFSCLSQPGRPVQTFEYTSGDCGGLDSKKALANLGKNSKDETKPKEILCIYEAVCQPSGGDEKEMTDEELTDAVAEGKMKHAMLVCKGTATLEENGDIESSNCPPPSKCQHDVFYNFSSSSISPKTIKKAIVKVPSAKKSDGGQ